MTGDLRTRVTKKESDVHKKEKKSDKWNVLLGRKGEEAVCDWLVAQGWLIIKTNWRLGRYCEIDLIAQDQAGVLVFLEVKTRCHNDESGFQNGGFDSINRRKQKKIVTSAHSYVTYTKARNTAYRIDAVLVEYKGTHPGQSMDDFPEPVITHVQNAFGSAF